MWVRHFSPLYLSGLGLARPDLVPQHVHALVARADKLIGLRELALAHGEPEHRVNEVGRAAVTVEVGNEFLSRHSLELGVEAGLETRWALSTGGAPAGPDSCLGR